MQPRLINTREAAQYCGVSREFLQANYPGRQIQIGTRYKWDLRVLDKWIDQMSGLSNGIRTSANPMEEFGWDEPD